MLWTLDYCYESYYITITLAITPLLLLGSSCACVGFHLGLRFPLTIQNMYAGGLETLNYP